MPLSPAYCPKPNPPSPHTLFFSIDAARLFPAIVAPAPLTLSLCIVIISLLVCFLFHVSFCSPAGLLFGTFRHFILNCQHIVCVRVRVCVQKSTSQTKKTLSWKVEKWPILAYISEKFRVWVFTTKLETTNYIPKCTKLHKCHFVVCLFRVILKLVPFGSLIIICAIMTSTMKSWCQLFKNSVFKPACLHMPTN